MGRIDQGVGAVDDPVAGHGVRDDHPPVAELQPPVQSVHAVAVGHPGRVGDDIGAGIGLVQDETIYLRGLVDVDTHRIAHDATVATGHSDGGRDVVAGSVSVGEGIALAAAGESARRARSVAIFESVLHRIAAGGVEGGHHGISHHVDITTQSGGDDLQTDLRRGPYHRLGIGDRPGLAAARICNGEGKRIRPALADGNAVRYVNACRFGYRPCGSKYPRPFKIEGIGQGIHPALCHHRRIFQAQVAGEVVSQVESGRFGRFVDVDAIGNFGRGATFLIGHLEHDRIRAAGSDRHLPGDAHALGGGHHNRPGDERQGRHLVDCPGIGQHVAGSAIFGAALKAKG